MADTRGYIMRIFNLFGELALNSTVQDVLSMLRIIARPLQMVTGGGSNRLSVDVNAVTGAVGTVTTVTTVTTVNTVANQTNLGGVSAFELQKAMSNTAWATNIVPLIKGV